ncbi:MAG: SUMF1/EgtB/PvdO family nonheme iron enzyme [Isosphaeraceae bacterium]
MAESKDPKRPAPQSGPGNPLPRLWKHDSDGPDSSESPGSTGRKKGKRSEEKPDDAAPRKKSKESDGVRGSKKPALVEETPELDTYETRQRVRILVGVGIVAFFLLLGWGVAAVFLSGRGADDMAADDGMPPPPAPGTSKEQLEKEARILFERARELAKSGKTSTAVSMLQRMTTSYAGTTAATEAKEALERPARNLPLFLDSPAVVASTNPATNPTPPSSAPAPGPRGVVEAVPTKVAATTGAEAGLTLPANPAEPSASPGAGQTAQAPVTPSRPLPKGFYSRPGAKVHESGWATEILSERDGAAMVLVPGGTFLQGRDGADPAEAPLHRVILPTYYIDQHEVTVRQFNLFQKEAGRRSERARALARDGSLSAIDSDESRPVVMVSARDAADYAAWAGKRLPTEAQWEAAARTPDGRAFPWGNDPETPRDPKHVGPILAFKKDQSPYAVFDLAGNAQEWTKDWFDARYYQLYRSAPADNPTGPATRPRSQQLVVKGSGADWLVSRREGIRYDVRLPYLGFRCVLPVEGANNAFEPPAAPAAPGQPAAPGGSVVPF